MTQRLVPIRSYLRLGFAHRLISSQTAIYLLLVSLICPPSALAQSAPTLPAGSWVWVRLYRTVDSKTAVAGQKIDAVTVKAIKRHKVVVLPAQTRLKGRIAAAHPADPAHKIPAELKLEFNELILPDGTTLPIKASLQFQPWPARISPWERLDSAGLGAASGALSGLFWGGKAVAIGAGVGAGIGLISLWMLAKSRWQDVEFSVRSKFFLRLDADLPLPTTKSPANP